MDALGRVFAARAVSRTHEDAAEHPKSTSQAEYAGSIPVIGSTLTCLESFRRARTLGSMSLWVTPRSKLASAAAAQHTDCARIGASAAYGLGADVS
ncbi:MAG: hypothetical protein WBD77_21775, partial [Mycobacterium sp.]